MRSCILHVTEHEYNHILQLNHNSLTWRNGDSKLQEGLEALLGKDVAEQVLEYESCRLKKHDSLDAIPRVEESAEVTADDLSA